jgi:hypothetical protein
MVTLVKDTLMDWKGDVWILQAGKTGERLPQEGNGYKVEKGKTVVYSGKDTKVDLSKPAPEQP